MKSVREKKGIMLKYQGKKSHTKLQAKLIVDWN